MKKGIQADTDDSVLLMRNPRQNNRSVFFDIGVCNKCLLHDDTDIAEQKGEDICSILPALYCLNDSYGH